jgi:gingipain R
MRFIYFFALFFTCNFYFGQKEFTVLNETTKEITIQFNFNEKPFSFKELDSKNYIDFSKSFAVLQLNAGAPALPSFGETFLIPSKGETELVILSSEMQEYSNVDVLPSKGNLKRNVNPENVPYVFGDSYTKNEFYPSNPIELVKPFIARTVRGQVLRISPYQYNPVTKTLRVYTRLILKLVNNSSKKGQNEIEKELNPSDLTAFSSIAANKLTDKYTVVSEEGDLLVISPLEYKNAVQELVEWKIKKGIKTDVKTTDLTGNTATTIKTFISEYYNTHPNLKNILLVGDSDKIPAYSYGSTWSEELYSDSYYGQLDGDDYYPEVFVGRLSGNSQDIALMVQRILEYEKNPKTGSWLSSALGLASSEGAGFGDDNQADWQHMRGIRNQLLDFGYTTVHEFYDGSRGEQDMDGAPSSQAILDAVNAGVSLFNYTGHGDLNTCITGNFSSSHINQASNTGMYPFVISVACNNGTFIDANCLAESWLKAKQNNEPTGAIAVCASSILMAWAPPMQTQDEMTLINTKAYLDNQKATLGGLFYNAQMSMLEEYGAAGEEVMQTWVFFGDPTVDLRNKATNDIVVEHVSEINPDSDVNELFTSLTEDAKVVVSKENQILGTGLISSGTSTISIPAQEDNTMLTIVATKQNHKPYIGQIQVRNIAKLTEKLTQNFSVYPNPTTNKLLVNVTNKQAFSYEIVDLSGKVIQKQEGLSSPSISVENLEKGIYQVVFYQSEIKQIVRFVKE